MNHLPFDPYVSPIDEALAQTVHALTQLDAHGERMAKVFRETFDQAYDGGRTGRYSLHQLMKTEKSHFGSLIEINFQREFGFEDGDSLDFSIAGSDVDCKYSHTGNWMLPPESFGQLILVLQADDARSIWSAGIVRVTEENRRSSKNRDQKTGLNKLGRSRINWLHHNAPMQPNALLNLDPAVVEKIMGGASGQKRVNELFRSATNTRLTRNIIATVAQQQDPMKRVRANGGARTLLQPEGYIILSGDFRDQRLIAQALGVVIPEPGEFVSVRVVRCADGEGAQISGGYWRIAQPDEPSDNEAPEIKDGRRN